MTTTLVFNGSASITGLWFGELVAHADMQRAVAVAIELEVEDLLGVARATATLRAVAADPTTTAGLRVTSLVYEIRVKNGSDAQVTIANASLNTRTAEVIFGDNTYILTFGGVESSQFEASGAVFTPADASAGASATADNSDAEEEALLGALLVIVLVAGVAFIAYRKLHAEKDYNLGDAEASAYGANQAIESTGNGTSYVQKKKRSMHAGTGGALSGNLFTIAQQPQNMPKNRDRNRLPYDATIVPVSAYVNASLVKGHGVRKYIAAQGPMDNTAADFWRMVVEQKSNTVAMLGDVFEDGQAMCHQYWPQAVGKALDFTDEAGRTVSVSCRSTDSKDGFTQTTLNVKVDGAESTVKHLQFSGWSDRKLPADPSALIKFREAVAASAGEYPATVHCNNGTGRTGTYIVFDMAIERFQASADDTEMAEVLYQSRTFRPYMIEQPAQYIFAHNAFVEFLLQQASNPAAGLSSDHADFVKRFQVPPRLYPFDLGRGGRSILSMEKCTLLPPGRLSASNLRAAAAEPTSGRIVLCSDIVIVVREEATGALVLETYADRINVKCQSVTGQVGQLKVRVGKELKLKFESEDSKAAWKASLENMDKYVRTAELSGKRLMSLKPSSRRDALRIMRIVDPDTQEGADSLKSEFEQIPTIIQPATDYASSVAAVNDGRTLGDNRAVANPLYGEVMVPQSPGAVSQDQQQMYVTANPMNAMRGGLSGAPMINPLSSPMTGYSMVPAAGDDSSYDIAQKLLELEEELNVAEALRVRQAEASEELGGYMDVSPGYGGIAGASEVGGYMTVNPVSVPTATTISGYSELKPGQKPSVQQLDEITKNIKLANRATADVVQRQLSQLATKKPNSETLDVQGSTQAMMRTALSPPQPTPAGTSAMDKLKARVSASKAASPAQAPAPASSNPSAPSSPTRSAYSSPVKTAPAPAPYRASSRPSPKKAWAPTSDSGGGGFTLTKSATKRMSHRPTAASAADAVPVFDEATKARMRASGLVVPDE